MLDSVQVILVNKENAARYQISKQATAFQPFIIFRHEPALYFPGQTNSRKHLSQRIY